MSCLIELFGEVLNDQSSLVVGLYDTLRVDFIIVYCTVINIKEKVAGY